MMQPRDGLFLMCLLCGLMSAKSTSIHGDSPEYIEDEDTFNRPWEVPNLEGTGLVAIDGDIVAPIGKKSNLRKALDFDQLFGLKKWPDGVVPYRISQGVTSREIWMINVGIKHWEDRTCLKFVPANPLQFMFYVNFRTDQEGCYSMVGRMPFGQDINMGKGCVRHRVAVHEIGHAIGFYHEQSRSDRDDHIEILWDNIEPGLGSQFRKVKDKPRGVPYDYSSVMQYPAGAFTSHADKNTIVARNPFMQLSLGKDRLSFRDQKMANAMYNCDEGCTNRSELRCKNGGFMFMTHGKSGPCKCVCPPNTSGDGCETILDRSYYEHPKCGGNITAEGIIQTPNAPQTLRKDGPCIFWIQAPHGKVPQVEFTIFKYSDRKRPSNDSKSPGFCFPERVEIRTSSLVEGDVYCSDELHEKTLTAKIRSMIIIATAKNSGSPGGFVGVVRFVDKQHHQANNTLSAKPAD